MKIAVLGGGQLARMLAEAARPLGISVRFLDPGIDACAASVAEQIVGAFDDQKQLETLTRDADVATYEFENVPQASIDFLGKKLPVFPSALALSSA